MQFSEKFIELEKWRRPYVAKSMAKSVFDAQMGDIKVCLELVHKWGGDEDEFWEEYKKILTENGIIKKEEVA